VKTPPDIQKLKRLIPQLGSGEADAVIAAVDAIIRCVQSTGHTLDDFAGLLVLPRRTHRDFARSILAQHADDLLEKELKFLQVMARRPRCTEKQAIWLEDIRFF
jgi:hypothetical protein